MDALSEYYGVGIYGVAEAARLTGVRAARIRRWVKGYAFKGAKGEGRKSAPVWRSQLPPLDDDIALGFLDLTEVRFVMLFYSTASGGPPSAWRSLTRAIY